MSGLPAVRHGHRRVLDPLPGRRAPNLASAHRDGTCRAIGPTSATIEGMTQRVIDSLADVADQLRGQAAEAEKIGKLTDHTVKTMKAARQHPAAAAEAARWLGGSSARVRRDRDGHRGARPGRGLDQRRGRRAPLPAGVRRSRVGAEIWGDDVDTWVASPYAPQGVAKPVDGGYIFNGRWQFSSGTDHCDWIFLGAMIGDADGQATDAAADAAHDPAAQGLRDRRGLVERRRLARHRVQGRHRRGRVRARPTGRWTP